ncbi:MAG: hypothetical protein ACLTTP_07020 [Alistipes ihumii]
MHMRGTPTMQTMTRYDDLTGKCSPTSSKDRLAARRAYADRARPGFGFSKTVEQNFRLLGEMHRLGELGIGSTAYPASR